MINEILIRRKIKARDVSSAMKIIKTKYPYARMITYKFDKDFRFMPKKDYPNRTITVVFIRDFMKIREAI